MIACNPHDNRRRPRHRIPWTTAAAVLCIGLASFATAKPVSPEIAEELEKPITLRLTGNRTFEGTFAGVTDGRVALRVIQSGGEILLTFSKAEIESVHFPGNQILEQSLAMVEEKRWEAAMPYLEALLLQRQPLFDLLSRREQSFYAAVPRAAIARREPAKAITYAEFLDDYLVHEEDLQQLTDCILLGYHMLGMEQEATTRARDWIDNTPRYADSALGYFVLAAWRFRNGDYEEALRLSLEPIVFSGQSPVDYLDHCYSVAIASTFLDANPGHADTLQEEMAARGLSWQYLTVFEEAREELSDFRVQVPDSDPLPLFEALPPEENLLFDNEKSVGTGRFIDPSGLIPL